MLFIHGDGRAPWHRAMGGVTMRINTALCNSGSSFIDMEGKNNTKPIDRWSGMWMLQYRYGFSKGPILVYRNRSEGRAWYLLLSLSEWSVDDSQTCQYRSLENHGLPVNGPAVQRIERKSSCRILYWGKPTAWNQTLFILQYSGGFTISKPSALTTHREGWTLCWIDSTRLAVSYLDKHNKSDDSTFWWSNYLTNMVR